MNLLQLIVIVTGFVFFLFSIDLYERKKFNLLHFLVFFCGTGAVVLFVMRPDLLDRFGDFFGVASGADLLVYLSIILLAYLYFEMLNKFTKQKITMTNLVTNIALLHSHTPIEAGGRVVDEKDAFCFLVRAYNEGSVIASVLEEVIDAGFTKIVVCNDGSSDSTSDIVKALKKKYSNAQIILLEHPINRGPGAANRTLFTRAKQYAENYGIQRLVTYDADGQMNIEDMNKFIAAADVQEVDVLLGSRFMEGGVAHNISWIRRIILWGSKFVTLLFNKIYVTDPTNGFKVIHRHALQKIELESDGFMYASEFLEQVKQKGLRRKEIPVHIKYTEYSMEKGQKSGNAWKILQSLVYKSLFYK